MKMFDNWYELAQCLSDIKIVEMRGYPTEKELIQIALLTGLIIIAEVLNNDSVLNSIPDLSSK